MIASKIEDEKVYLYIDESYGEYFCGVCVVCIQGKDNHDLLMDQIRKINIDPSVKAYNTSGKYHYVDDDISTRQSLVPWISKMPISAYIAFARSNIPKTEQDKYDFIYNLLLPNLLKPLKIKFNNRMSTQVDFLIHFENVDSSLNKNFTFFDNVLKKTQGYENISPIIVTKEQEPLIFIPDYFLGYIRDNLTVNPEKTWPINSLKLLAHKIGLVLIKEGKGFTHYGRDEDVLDFLR